MLNAERQPTDVPALGWSAALVSSAHRHNLTMAAANLLSHQLPGEPVFSTRISQAGVAWHSAAENIGWTTDVTSRGADSLEVAMYNESAPDRRPPAQHPVHLGALRRHRRLLRRRAPASCGSPRTSPTSPAPAARSARISPFGNLDTATRAARPQGPAGRLGGRPGQQGHPLFIAVFWDGHFAGYFRKPMARPDVARAKGAGPMQGYCIFIVMPAGRHTVNTFGVNVGAGTAMTKLASKVVTV